MRDHEVMLVLGFRLMSRIVDGACNQQSVDVMSSNIIHVSVFQSS